MSNCSLDQATVPITNQELMQPRAVAACFGSIVVEHAMADRTHSLIYTFSSHNLRDGRIGTVASSESDALPFDHDRGKGSHSRHSFVGGLSLKAYRHLISRSPRPK